MSKTIPAAALASHIAVLGKTGSGKSYAVRGIVEQLLDEGARCCIIDPTGTWWGLKSSITGKSKGYPVVIFGGTHADLPLGATHGEALAEAIGTSSTPAILDTSQMKVGERTRFFADFADALVRKNKGPLHLVIDEAHLFAPQGKVNDPQSGAMLHAANNLVSLGRSRGLRIVLITQRPAKLHKDSLTQVETLIAMRLIAPQDRKAVEEWIKDNADLDKGREVISSLATLKTGQAWVWAPELRVLERVQFPLIGTYDSSAAPDGYAGLPAPVLAPIDIDAIAGKLKAIAAEVQSNNPVVLKQRIQELERQLRAASILTPTPAARKEELEAADKAGYERGYYELVPKLHEAVKALRVAGGDIEAVALRIEQDVPRLMTRVPRQPSNTLVPQKEATRILSAMPLNSEASAIIGTGGKRRIMVALAQYPGGLTAQKLSILVDISKSGGTWSTYMGQLRGAGFIDGGNEGMMITQAGLKALGKYEPLPTGQELIDYWRRRLGDGGKRRIFDVVVGEYPAAVDADEVARATNISRSGGTWSTYMGELRGLGLIEGSAQLRASDNLF